jgi:hypothetical protein
MGAVGTFIDRREARTRSCLAGEGQSGFRWRVGREFVPHIMLKELSPPEADFLGEPQQPTLLADESAIELVELLDEVLDARAVEAHPLEQLDAL